MFIFSKLLPPNKEVLFTFWFSITFQKISPLLIVLGRKNKLILQSLIPKGDLLKYFETLIKYSIPFLKNEFER